MSDREPPDAPKVPRTADFQQKDADQIKDAVERLLRAYVDRRSRAITNSMNTSATQSS